MASLLEVVQWEETRGRLKRPRVSLGSALLAGSHALKLWVQDYAIE
ncbi:hypothetical protein GL4_2856 [Methyloceanibacter caenitepidi]|uniref:Uncharacterized protein n=1 Tax=Methyloceanibacter caenitepidi TaxID=1384459 RepID=A0A0A8K8H6_9HYPH|nr:hypothetical protein GL4_2856 [Methyloceanibacter caenitepidi]